MKRLEELCHISSGGTPSRKKPEFFGGSILWAKISDIENAESGIIVDTEEKITEAGLANIRNKVFPKGTLLFAMYASIGKVAFAGQEMSCNQAILGINPKRKNEVYLPYLKVWFEQNKRKLAQDGRGGVFKNLSATIIRNTKVDLPPYQDQIRIAEVLSKVERLISQRKESINLLDELLKSTFLEMFGDPALNSKNWPKIKLSNLGILDRGVSKHRPRNAPELLGGEYPLIQTGEVSKSGLYINDYSQTYSELGLKQSKMWPNGTLCITIAANIAKTGILNFAACFPDSIVGFTNSKREVVIYVHFLFGFLQRILEKNAPAAAQKNINLRILRDLLIPEPDEKTLINFSAVVLSVEQLREKLQVSLKELENLTGSLSQLAFKGGLYLNKLEIDHIIPFSKGRTDAEENLQVVSSKENRRIADKPKTIRVGKAIMENLYEEDIAQLLKEYFGKFDFNFNEVIELFEDEKGVALNYLTSEELKRNRQQLEQDIKTFIFSCVEGKNSHLKLKQWFFNAFDDLELKTLNPRSGREKLLDEINESSGMLELEDVAGIYFKIEE